MDESEERVEDAGETVEDEGPIRPALREGLEELDPYLATQPEDQLGRSVLPLATRWVLEDVDGLELERLTDEVTTFVVATPLADRVLRRFPRDVTRWLTLRMDVDGQTHEPRPGVAARILESAREQIAARAELLDEEGFRNVARAFRALLDETAGGEPPADPIFEALALRIAEPFLQDPANPVPPTPSASLPPSDPPGPGPE